MRNHSFGTRLLFFRSLETDKDWKIKGISNCFVDTIYNQLPNLEERY